MSCSVLQSIEIPGLAELHTISPLGLALGYALLVGEEVGGSVGGSVGELNGVEDGVRLLLGLNVWTILLGEADGRLVGGAP